MPVFHGWSSLVLRHRFSNMLHNWWTEWLQLLETLQTTECPSFEDNIFLGYYDIVLCNKDGIFKEASWCYSSCQEHVSLIKRKEKEESKTESDCSLCKVLWPQQKVRSSCWSSMFNGIRPEPTNNGFIPNTFKLDFLFVEKFTVIPFD